MKFRDIMTENQVCGINVEIHMRREDLKICLWLEKEFVWPEEDRE